MNLQNPPLAAPISHANRKLTSQRIADMHCAFKDGEKGGLAPGFYTDGFYADAN